jgi:RHS repeat-associated protein
MTTATLPTGTGIVSTYGHDNADRLTSISHVKGGGTTVASVAYTLDDVGNRTQRVDQQGTHNYVYDDLHRLTSVTYPGPSTTTYDFDAFGNREEMIVGAASTTYAYDDADRLTAVTPPSPASVVNYTWDDNGNLSARGGDSFSWDYDDRMTSATVNSVTTNFVYRGDGLRNSRAVSGGATTTFTWDIAGGLPVVLDDGNQYVYGAALTSMKQGGNWYYYLADGLGSTMAVVDSTGASQKSYTYDVYGEATPSGGLANEFDFAGQQTDGTGLQYLRARYYDPETGTFLSREPMAIGPNWLGNTHGYGGGNPAGFIDPSGMFRVDSDDTQFREYWNWVSADLVFGHTLVPWQWIEQRSIDGRPYGLYRVCELIDEYSGAITCGEGVGAEVLQGWLDDARASGFADGLADLVDDVLGALGVHKPGRLRDNRAKCIQDRYGVSIHSLKEGLRAGYDLFVEADGEIVVKPKSGRGPGDPTGRNMNEFKGC